MPSLMYMYGYVAPKLLARLKRPLAAEHAFHELRKLPTVCSVTGCDAPLNLSRPSSAETRGAGNRTRAFRTHQLLRPKSNNNNQLWTPPLALLLRGNQCVQDLRGGRPACYIQRRPRRRRDSRGLGGGYLAGPAGVGVRLSPLSVGIRFPPALGHSTSA